MNTVNLSLACCSQTLESGRTVEVGRSNDGAHWAFRFGNLDDPEDSIRFAISAEAFEAMEHLAAKLKKQQQIFKWVLQVTPALSALMGDQSACAASDAPQVAGDSSRDDQHNNTEQTP